MSRSIIITGASSGIGRAAAEKFLREGWQVGLIARRQRALAEVAADHAGAHMAVADVTDADALKGAFSALVGKMGRLDVLFNNAGIFGASGPIDEIDVAEWRRALDVNVSGMFYAARLAFAQMRRQSPRGGRIINNGSVSAHSPRPGSVCYTTTKHAITGLTRSLSLDGRDFDIACGQIDTGNAHTAMIDNLNVRLLAADPEAVPVPTIDVADVAGSVFYMAGLPLSANVQFMTVMATKMPYIGRG